MALKHEAQKLHQTFRYPTIVTNNVMENHDNKLVCL